MKKILVNGLGLMGASLANTLAQLDDYYVYGYDNDEQTLKTAVAKQVIHEAIVLDGFDYSQIDLIILGMPPKAIVTSLTILKSKLKQLPRQPLVMDLGSIKTKIMQAGASLAHFVGGHPMAGSDKTGIAARQAGMYENRPFFLCGSHDDIQKIEEILAPLKAKWQTISATDHDQIVAGISDLPHVMAFALVNSIAKQTPHGWQTAIAGGFKDTTRIAQANSQLWTEILMANHKATVKQLDGLIDELENFKQLLETGNSQQLIIEILKANKIRRTLA